MMASPNLSSIDDKASLLALSTQLRREIFKSLFRDLIVSIRDASALAKPVGHPILASICATCCTFSVEAKPLFYQLAAVLFAKPTCWSDLMVSVAWSSTKSPLPFIRNIVVSTSADDRNKFTNWLHLFPGVMSLTISLQPFPFVPDLDYKKMILGGEEFSISESEGFYHSSRGDLLAVTSRSDVGRSEGLVKFQH
jgi:hypothetical protein